MISERWSWILFSVLCAYIPSSVCIIYLMGDGCVMDLCSKTGASRKKQLQQQSIESNERRKMKGTTLWMTFVRRFNDKILLQIEKRTPCIRHSTIFVVLVEDCPHQSIHQSII